MNLSNLKTVSIPDDSLMTYHNGKLLGNYNIEAIQKELNFNSFDKIITSKDEIIQKAITKLQVPIVPAGFKKYQLPILNSKSDNLMFISFAEPNSICPIHKHEIDRGFRLIIKGSLILNNAIKLLSGDWFYVPKGCEYGFETGENGAVIFHAYSPVDI